MNVLTGPWPARVTWALGPLLVAPALGASLEQHSRAVSLTGAALAWATWAGVLVAVLVPRTVSLTALRVAAPAVLGSAIWAASAAGATLASVSALVAGSLTVMAAFSPFTGQCFVNGSAYGDEYRLPLRVPAAVLLGPIVLAEIAVVAPVVAGPLLLAAGQWGAGGLVVAIGAPTAWFALRALHGLSRRWVVFVPAGLVLHDRHTMNEAVLFPRRLIARVGPARDPLPPDTLDLTAGSLGLAVELVVSSPLEVAPRRNDRTVKVVTVPSVVFTPTRPGALLAEATRRRLPVE